MKRASDLAVVLGAIVLRALHILIVALAVRVTSPGPALYWNGRVGRHDHIFKLLKFRSMRIDMAALTTHLLKNPDQWLTSIGSLLRISSLDERPQLWSPLKGHMNFVGHRPALFHQDGLIILRTARGVHKLLPGLTSWAQVNARNQLPIPQKVQLDAEYLQRRSFLFDLKVLWMTALKVLSRAGVAY